MNASRIIACIVCPLVILACAQPAGKADSHNPSTTDSTGATAVTATKDSFPRGAVIRQVTCRSDMAVSYALYLPAKPTSKPLPVIYFFDPHGDGVLPVGKYKQLADTFGFILIGSNDSRNGNDWTTSQNIWNTITADSRARLNIEPDRLYTAGFSGGAKVASFIALNDPGVKGVIANGAGLPDGTRPGDFNFSFTAITGEGDMNMTDLVDLDNNLDKTQTRHRIIFFNGKHEWAPEQTMRIAFQALVLDGMRRKLVDLDDKMIVSFVSEARKEITTERRLKELIKAQRTCDVSISLLDGLTPAVTWFKETDDSLLHDVAYQRQFAAQQALLQKEEKLKQLYNQQFERADLNYWTTTIRDLDAKAAGHDAASAMYQRLLAYLSLAFYSFSNQLLNNNQNDAAAYFVTLYKMADPTNSEAWYFSAVINARKNNAKAAENDLLKAAEYGFKDENRMMLQPEFQSLAHEINFGRIKEEMKNNH